MTYTTPTPSTVSAGDTFPASAYNIISADIQDHESRIKTGVESYTTAQKTALTGVSTGTVVYDSTLAQLQVWNGTAWKTAAQSTVVPMCQMVVTPSLSIANGTDQTVTSASFSIDTDTMGGTANRITITTAGVYAVSYSLIYSVSATGYRAATVAVNGVGSAASSTGQGYTLLGGWAAAFTTLTNTKLVSLLAGDYLTLVTVQTSGAALAFTGGNQLLQAQYVSRIV